MYRRSGQIITGKAEWRVSIGEDGDVSACTPEEEEVRGVSTTITPGSITVIPIHFVDDDFWSITLGWHDSLTNIFDDSAWAEVHQHDRMIAGWHRELLKILVKKWQHTFLDAVSSGEAHIMARKSLLAPFERIFWDQWQFFSLGAPPSTKSSDLELRTAYYLRSAPATAVGPTGERLYSIYVAPGVRPNSVKETPEQKCRLWITGLLREYPKRPPKPLDQMAAEAISKFPGLSKSRFVQGYRRACEDTGNFNWSRAGRPKKISAEIPPKKINPVG